VLAGANELVAGLRRTGGEDIGRNGTV
jgi:hypothetical protein